MIFQETFLFDNVDNSRKGNGRTVSRVPVHRLSLFFMALNKPNRYVELPFLVPGVTRQKEP
jgi:hypothetical protein